MPQVTIHLEPGVITDIYDASGFPREKTITIQSTGGYQVQLSENPDMSGAITLNPSGEAYENIIPGSAYAKSGSGSSAAWCSISVSTQSFKPASQEGELRPIGLYRGERAQTVAFYPEQNVKNGLQFYIRKSFPNADAGRGLSPISSGQSVFMTIATTTKTVLAKSRIVNCIGEEFSIEVFDSPVITQGNEGDLMTVRNYNRENPQPTTVEFRKNVVVSSGDEGVPFDDEPEYYFGAQATGQRVSNSIPEGRERVLEKNKTYLIKITNTGSGDGRLGYFLDWYEGDPDLPRPAGEL